MSTTSGNTAIIEHLRARVAQLEAELAEARTDPVTSLPTRRHFMRLAVAAFPDAGAVLLADVDGFKQVNDTHRPRGR
jgi:GGDEF domain-containing protein